jgi:hypothetical protein
VLGPYGEGQVSALNPVQKRAAKLANNINGTAKIQICALFQGIHQGTGLGSTKR